MSRRSEATISEGGGEHGKREDERLESNTSILRSTWTYACCSVCVYIYRRIVYMYIYIHIYVYMYILIDIITYVYMLRNKVELRPQFVKSLQSTGPAALSASRIENPTFQEPEANAES